MGLLERIGALRMTVGEHLLADLRTADVLFGESVKLTRERWLAELRLHDAELADRVERQLAALPPLEGFSSLPTSADEDLPILSPPHPEPPAPPVPQTSSVETPAQPRRRGRPRKNPPANGSNP